MDVKLAAFEGLYNTESNAPLTVIGWVDEAHQKVIGLQIPYMLSVLAFNNPHATVTGLNSVPPADRPPVQPCFMFFHGMVGIGFTMIAVAALGFLYFRHGSLHERRWLLWILVFSVLLPRWAGSRGLSMA